jgi:hypothetical protein
VSHNDGFVVFVVGKFGCVFHGIVVVVHGVVVVGGFVCVVGGVVGGVQHRPS